MSQSLLRVQNLHFSYPVGPERTLPALCGVDLEICPGEHVAIVGANGSGKSTLARHFNALLLPTQGNVWVKGMNTRDPNHRREIRRTVAMVFQSPDSQIVATVVEEDVAFGPENLGVAPEELQRRVNWALEVVGLSAQRHRAPHHLSGGQKQRLALAGALAMQPACLVLDEATAMLDPAGRQALGEILRQLRAQGMTIVTITQAMEEAAEADRVVVLAAGQIARQGTPRQVFAPGADLPGLGLDVPPAARLAQVLHRRFPDFPPDLVTPTELIAALKARALARGEQR